MTTEAHVIAGHKANLHNPNTSDEAKDHSKEVLKENFNRKQRRTSSPVEPIVCTDICLDSCRGWQQDQGP